LKKQGQKRCSPLVDENKGVTLKTEKANKLLKIKEIFVVWFILCGMPQEQAQSNADQASLCPFTLYPLPFRLSYFLPYTGP
jgi:hypothetical protein